MESDELGAVPEDLGSGLSGPSPTQRLIALPAPEVESPASSSDGSEHETLATPSSRRISFVVPAQPTPIIGREQDIQAVIALLRQPDVRLITITGPGGIGKTRLACEVGRLLGPDFDEVSFVDFSSHADHRTVMPVIFHALRSDRRRRANISARSVSVPLHAPLPEQSTLLILDNFEHVTEVASALASLLSAIPNLRIVITSRAVLNLRWEHVYVVAPLFVPNHRNEESLDQLMTSPAIALFLDRARSTHPALTVTDEDVRTIAEICAQLDGNPLEMDMAARYTAVLPPGQLLSSLQGRLDFLTHGSLDLPARQQGLRASLDWSYRLLSPAEQRLARHLSVFAGGGTIVAAEAVISSAADRGLGFVVDGISGLVDQSILQVADSLSRDRRFLMTLTQNEYLREHLALDPEEQEIASRHAAFFLKLAEQATPSLHGPAQLNSLRCLESEHDNLRAALRWAIDANDLETGLRLGVALSRFWIMGSHVPEGRRWLDALLELNAPEQLYELRLKALTAAAELAARQGSYSDALRILNDSCSQCLGWSEHDACAPLLTMLGIARLCLGDHTHAAMLLAESIKRLRAGNDTYRLAQALRASAMLAMDVDEFRTAVSLLEEGRNLSVEAGDLEGEALALRGLGDAALYTGDISKARAHCQNALEIARQHGNSWAEAAALVGMGNSATAQEPHTISWYRNALMIYRTLGDQHGVVDALEGIACHCASRPILDIAPSPIIAVTTRTRAEIGYQRNELQLATLTRLGIGHQDSEPHPARDPERTLDFVVTETVEALNRALQQAPWEQSLAASLNATSVLSRRESEVVEGISRGLTNREIAETLGIAERTIDSHVSNALRKLQLKSRSAIAAWAVERRMNPRDGSDRVRLRIPDRTLSP